MGIMVEDVIVAKSRSAVLAALRDLPIACEWQLVEQVGSHALFFGPGPRKQPWPAKVAVVVGEAGPKGTTRVRFVSWDIWWGARGQLGSAILTLRRLLRLVDVSDLQSPERSASGPPSEFIRWTRLAGLLPLVIVVPMAFISFTVWEPAWVITWVVFWLCCVAVDLVPRRALGLRSKRGVWVMAALVGLWAVMVILLGLLA
jgi:hypothetical protein